MEYVVFFSFLVVNLGIVSALIYGRATGHGVPAAAARRVLLELWAAAAIVLGILAYAGWLTRGNVFVAGIRGQMVGFAAAAICLGVLLYALRRVNQVISEGPADAASDDSTTGGASALQPGADGADADERAGGQDR